MRTLILAGLVLAARAAHADDCDLLDAAPGTGATQLAESVDKCMGAPDCKRVVPPPARERHGFIAGGQATIGTLGQAQSDGEALSAGELAASGRTGWRSGLQACGSTDVLAGTQSRGDSSFHIVFPWPFFETVMLGGERQWQLRPRLDSSRIYLRRLYSSSEFSGGMAFYAWAHQDGGAGAVLPFRFDDARRDQDTTGATLETVHFAAFESTHPTSHLEVLPVTISTMYPHGVGTDAAPGAVSASLARVDAVALKYRFGAFTVDANGGAVFADHPLAAPVAGMLGFAWGPWSVHAQRAADLAMDDTLTIEDRADAAFHQGMWRAGAFAALTHTSSAPHPQLTGGGSAGMDVALPEQVKLALDVEVARSYYARLDGDPTPTPQFASVGTVTLARQFTYNPTAH